MNFTAREDYGLRAVLDLAGRGNDGPVQSREIAARQHIPEQFLEQLLGVLRRSGLVRSVRGASGGYYLAAPAGQITVGDVLRSLSGPLVPISCIENPEQSCEHGQSVGVHIFWDRLSAAIKKVADEMSIQDLLDLQIEQNHLSSYMMNI